MLLILKYLFKINLFYYVMGILVKI